MNRILCCIQGALVASMMLVVGCDAVSEPKQSVYPNAGPERTEETLDVQWVFAGADTIVTRQHINELFFDLNRGDELTFELVTEDSDLLRIEPIGDGGYRIAGLVIEDSTKPSFEAQLEIRARDSEGKLSESPYIHQVDVVQGIVINYDVVQNVLNAPYTMCDLDRGISLGSIFDYYEPIRPQFAIRNEVGGVEAMIDAPNGRLNLRRPNEAGTTSFVLSADQGMIEDSVKISLQAVAGIEKNAENFPAFLMGDRTYVFDLEEIDLFNLVNGSTNLEIVIDNALLDASPIADQRYKFKIETPEMDTSNISLTVSGLSGGDRICEQTFIVKIPVVKNVAPNINTESPFLPGNPLVMTKNEEYLLFPGSGESFDLFDDPGELEGEPPMTFVIRKILSGFPARFDIRVIDAENDELCNTIVGVGDDDKEREHQEICEFSANDRVVIFPFGSTKENELLQFEVEAKDASNETSDVVTYEAEVN